MKRIFIVISIFILIFLLFPQDASAYCAVKRTGKGAKPCQNITCHVSGTAYCCGTQQECDDLISQPPPPSLKCTNDDTGINTAIGCIHVLSTPEAFLAD